MTIGTRAQVFHGNADKTAGGLVASDLALKEGRIVSKAQVAAAKANPGLAMWREAVKKSGGLKEGKFVPIKGKILAKAHKKFEKLKKKSQ